MKKFLILIMLMCMETNVWAGHEGHNHGDDAFVGAKTSDVFVLSETQIKNLDLETTEVQKRIFYKTVNVPALVKKSSALNDIIVQGYVSEQRDILKIKEGQEVSLILDAFPNEVFAGKIIRLDSEMNPKTRFFTVVARVDEVSTMLVGFKGVLTVRVSKEKEGLAVPEKALQGMFGDYFVFIKDGEHFMKTSVIVGEKSEGMYEIISGLHLGQIVVTQGSYQLQYVTGISEEDHIHEDEQKEHIHNEHCEGDHIEERYVDTHQHETTHVHEEH